MSRIVRFDFDDIPKSLKNSRESIGRGRHRASERARNQLSYLRANLVLHYGKNTGTLFADDEEVELVLRSCKDPAHTWVEFRPAGPRAATKGRRMDIQNTLDIICDAGQGILYADDSQIVRVSAEWITPSGELAPEAP